MRQVSNSTVAGSFIVKEQTDIDAVFWKELYAVTYELLNVLIWRYEQFFRLSGSDHFTML